MTAYRDGVSPEPALPPFKSATDELVHTDRTQLHWRDYGSWRTGAETMKCAPKMFLKFGVVHRSNEVRHFPRNFIIWGCTSLFLYAR